MSLKKLSFVLPVYNVEVYIEKCIRSIRDEEMPFEDYEIIVVNDGSPDRSKSIVAKLQQEIPNITLIDQENEGVSAARNTGFDHASGEYVVFIDPDDFISPNMFSAMLDRAKKDNLDVLLTGRSSISEDGEVEEILGYGQYENQVFSGIDAFRLKDKEIRTYNSSVGYFYRRKFLQKYKIKYPLGVLHIEDGVFLRKVFAVAQRVGFENKNFYQVFLRGGSASRSEKKNSLEAVYGDLKSIQDLMRFKGEQKLSSEAIGLLDGMIAKFTLLPLIRAIETKSVFKFWKYARILKNNGLNYIDLERIPPGYMLDNARAFNHSPWLFGFRHVYNVNKRHVKNLVGSKNPVRS